MINKDLFKLIGKDKKYIIISTLLMFFQLLCNLLFTISVCFIFYLTLNNKIKPYGYYFFGALVFFLVLRYLLIRINGMVKDTLGRRVKENFRHKTYEKILKLGLNATDKIGMAGLTQVSVEGIEQLDLYYTNYLPQFFYALISPIILFIICVFLDYRTALVLLLCVPVIPISIMLVSKWAKKIFNKYWDKYITMGDSFLDNVSGLKELKLFNATGAAQKEIREKSETFRKVTMKVLVMQLVSITIMDLVAFGASAIGIVFALIGGMKGNNVIFVLFLILVAVEFFLPLRALGSSFHVAMNGVSAGKKIVELFKQEEVIWGKETQIDGGFLIKDVSFGYQESRSILEKVNLSFPKNKLTAIVGVSGSGKSTIVNLLTGAIVPTKGTVLLGALPILSYRREAFFNHVGVVSYNSYLFSDTIRQNFHYANKDLTDDEIYHYLKLVNLDKFIKEEGGLEKKITESATNISGGQRQRLCLAINLASQKKIYIFDEATSNIDIESEKIIMENVKVLSKEKTVILISHRLANVVESDNIFVLDNARVIESGTHNELIDKKGVYHNLYMNQKHLEEGYLLLKENQNV